MAKTTTQEARQWLESLSDEALGNWMRGLLAAQADDALGRYFRHILNEMTDEEFLAAFERNQRARYAAARPAAKA